MKKIVVISDTHNCLPFGNERFLTVLAECDLIVHAGDGAYDVHTLRKLFPDKIVSVRGNCDADGALSECFEFDGVRFYLCHGHIEGVKSGLDALLAKAVSEGATAVIYGHTHVAAIEKRDGVTLICPGAAASGGTYAYITVADGKCHAASVNIY